MGNNAVSYGIHDPSRGGASVVVVGGDSGVDDGGSGGVAALNYATRDGRGARRSVLVFEFWIICIYDSGPVSPSNGRYGSVDGFVGRPIGRFVDRWAGQSLERTVRVGRWFRRSAGRSVERTVRVGR